MHPDNLVLQKFRIQSSEDVKIESLGDKNEVAISAPGSSAKVSLFANGHVSMTAGSGKASVAVSEADGATVIAGSKAVKIGAGGPLASAIEMTMDGIVISLTPLVTIKLSQTGVEITAGVNKVTVGQEGITIKGIMLTEKAEAVHQKDQALSQDASKGPRKIGAALDTIGN